MSRNRAELEEMLEEMDHRQSWHKMFPLCSEAELDFSAVLGSPFVCAVKTERMLKTRNEKLRNMALVLMHKKTGNLYEYFWGGFFGEVIAWEDTTVEPLCHEIIDSASPMIFNDDHRWNLNDYELLGSL